MYRIKALSISEAVTVFPYFGFFFFNCFIYLFFFRQSQIAQADLKLLKFKADQLDLPASTVQVLGSQLHTTRPSLWATGFKPRTLGMLGRHSSS